MMVVMVFIESFLSPPSQHHHHTIITPPQHHNQTITTPSPHRHNTITTPSPHHHHTITTPPPHHHHTPTIFIIDNSKRCGLWLKAASERGAWEAVGRRTRMMMTTKIKKAYKTKTKKQYDKHKIGIGIKRTVVRNS